MGTTLEEVVTKATKFTASRPLTEAESELLLQHTEPIPFAQIDPRLAALPKLCVFDMRCIEYLQDCFSSNQLLDASDSGQGKPAQWLLLVVAGQIAAVKLDKTHESVSVHRLKGESEDVGKLVMERVLHWMWLRLTSNC